MYYHQLLFVFFQKAQRHTSGLHNAGPERWVDEARGRISPLGDIWYPSSWVGTPTKFAFQKRNHLCHLGTKMDKTNGPGLTYWLGFRKRRHIRNPSLISSSRLILCTPLAEFNHDSQEHVTFTSKAIATLIHCLPCIHAWSAPEVKKTLTKIA